MLEIKPLDDQFDELQKRYPLSTMIPVRWKEHVVHICEFPVPPGWTMKTVPIWFVVPHNFPYAKPMTFWTHPNLMLGSEPEAGWQAQFTAIGSYSYEGVPRGLQRFYWQPQVWSPFDTLRTYTGVVLSRFYQLR